MTSAAADYQLREVAVLFTDLKGFARLSQRVSGPVLFHFLNRYFERLGETVEAHGGSIDKFIGDAMMVVFHGENRAQNALQAAEVARDMVRALRGWRVEGVEFTPAAGFGIDAGEVVYGPVGTRSRKDVTVYGVCVNQAAILAGRAEPDQILTTQETANLLESVLPVQPADPKRVLGILGLEIPCFQVLLED